MPLLVAPTRFSAASENITGKSDKLMPTPVQMSCAFATPEMKSLEATETPTTDPLGNLPAAIKPASTAASGKSVWQRQLRGSTQAIVVDSDDSLFAAVKRAPERLSLQMGLGAITNAGLAALARCSSVRHLDLNWATAEEGTTLSVTVEAIAALAGCPLESLQLDCCISIDLTDAIVAIAERTRTLHHLAVYECCIDADVVMAALGRCSTLRSIDWHTYATDVSVWELVQGGVGGTGVSWLEVLRLATFQETSLTDDALVAIAASCPRLVTLDASELAISGISDDGILALAGKIEGLPGCPLLKHLDVGSSVNMDITDRTLTALCDGALPALEFLGLAGCGSVTRRALRALAARRPSIVVAGIESVECEPSELRIEDLSQQEAHDSGSCEGNWDDSLLTDVAHGMTTEKAPVAPEPVRVLPTKPQMPWRAGRTESVSAHNEYEHAVKRMRLNVLSSESAASFSTKEQMVNDCTSDAVAYDSEPELTEVSSYCV